MSSNGTDVKKRKLLNDEAFLESSTKKIKVQAQRKFAQNAVTTTNTQKPIQSPVVPSNAIKPPIKRPNTEDFLTFLCFRGTSLLPPRLDFFNKPQRSAQEIAAGKKRRKSTPILPVNNSNSNSDSVNSSVNSKLSETKTIRQLPKNTARITKLGHKVIGRNLVRSSSRYAAARQESLTLRQLALHHGSKVIKPKLKVKKPPPVAKNVKKDAKNDLKQKSLDGKKVPKLKVRSTRSNSLPSIFCPGINQLRDDKGKWCKRDSSKTSSKTSDELKDVEERPSRKKTASKSIDHRSNSLGNLKQKTSDIKCKVINKNDRKTRSLAGKYKKCEQDNYAISNKKNDKNLKTASKNIKANSLIETKLTVGVKRKTSSVDNMKMSRENKEAISSPRSRPPRRTKEAATLYMEMLKKDLRCPEEQEDDTSSVESFPDLPNTRINEQRERELKVFSKKSMAEKKLDEQCSENEDNHFLSLSNNKKHVVDNNVKEKKKSEEKILKKKNMKETVKTVTVPENDGTTSFKRNLRPRRSSTMLDDYIMTDSEEDDEKSEPVAVEIKKSEIHKLSTVTTAEVKLKKCKLSVTESDKKNLKTNKTDFKPKKDLNIIDSEVKKDLSKSKSKGSLLKHNKEPEIKNNKNTTADKKIEKLSKNKTETLVIIKEPTKITGKGSKNAGKKVPLSNKQQQQQLVKRENVSNKKKFDLYNNNNGSKKKSILLSVTSPSSPLLFSDDTSQTKANVLECMAANFDSKVDIEKPVSNKIVENHKVVVEEQKEQSVVTTDSEKTIVTNNDDEAELNTNSKLAIQCNKLELKKITKTENMVLAAKEECVDVVKKMENVIAVQTVDKLEKTESLQLMMPFNKVENAVFQTITKDLFLHSQKNEVKVIMPDYFSGKSFQLSNRFKQDDGLSVLSEICSALPRFDEPYTPPSLALPPPLEKKKEFSLVASPAVTQSTLLPPLFPPPSFESRTVKIVNLAQGNCTTTSAAMDKKDLTTWKQGINNLKMTKNGLTKTTNLVEDNLIQPLTQKKQHPFENHQITNTIAIDQSSPRIVNGNCPVEEKKQISTSHLCQKTNSVDSKTDVLDVKKGVLNSSYLAKTTILNSTKYDLKFEKRHLTTVATSSEKPLHQQQRRDADVSSSDDLQSTEKKIFGHQRRLSASQSYNCNSSDAFSPDNETSVYAFQPDLPVASTPFRRNKLQSPAKSRTVSPNNSISVSIENDSMEEKSHQSTVSSTTDADSEEGRLFYIPLPAGVQAQPLIQGVTVKLGTEGPQNKLVMSAKLVTKPPALTIPVSSISPKPERKIKPLCSTKANNSSTPVGTVQPTTRTVQPTKCAPSTSKQLLPLSLQPQNMDTKEEKKRLQPINTAIINPKELKKPSTSFSVSVSNKKPKKTEKQVNKRKSSEKVASKKKLFKECAEMMEAPTFYPSEEDFKDPLVYFDIIKSVAQKYGICRVVPPPSFKPDCKVTDDMRFTAYNQYVHKMMDRWGPNVRELIAMKKYLETQSIVLSNPPLIGGMELDLPRLYHTVQELGGLKEVIELDKWSRVADLMKIPKSAQASKLDDIYCKYLLPYDTLSHEERQKLIANVDKEWKQICKKGDSENELYEDVNDCIIKGRNIALSAYFRVARNTASMWFKEQQHHQGGSSNSSSSVAISNKLGTAPIRAEEVESLYWKQVHEKKNHICVLSGSIDSGSEGYGFPTTKTATFTKHPWNLKVMTNNSASVLKSLGPIMGMTVPTIHMGMMFSACCWYKDPHGLPWIEYLHTGADKVWYGVPSGQSDKFQAAMKRLLPRAVAEGQNHHTWLAADSGMVPPNMLIDSGVSVTRTVQNPGQFLIVMPHAYTCNVSTGYVISESVYFTQSNWLNGAEKIFQDLQRNCEPAAFSFEKLLINMSSDQRTPQHILKQLLGILSNMRDCEIALRSQLVEDLGLKASERIRPVTSKSNEQDDDYECGVCHSILYISMVNNSHEDCDYCLRHGIEILSKKHNQLKYCKFMYTFDEDELDTILVKLRERIVSKKKKMSYIKSQ